MKTNNKLLNSFLINLETERGKSKNTINSYENDIIQLFEYLKRVKSFNNSINNLDKDFFNTIEYMDLQGFVKHLFDIGNVASTRARKISSVREFFKYLKNKLKVIDENPALELETPKLPKINPKFLNVEESRDMIKSITSRNKERDIAIVTLFLNLGLRVSELVNIDTTDIKDDKIRVIRKGNEEMFLPLNEACINTINKYLKVRPEIDEKALFLSEQQNRMSTNTIRYLTKKYGDVNPHLLRHSFATNLLGTNKVNIRQLQELLNHKSTETTARYTHVTNQQMVDAINANPY